LYFDKTLQLLFRKLHLKIAIYIDRYFTTVQLLHQLAGKQLFCTGTRQKNRMTEASQKLTVDEVFMKKDQGTSEADDNCKLHVMMPQSWLFH